ncbi:MAG: glycosyltransferase family 4 protein [Chloroflexi bacterium]|nr:glycosyltransferase family 4 protein [Chloroflexota bacterium]
MNKKSQTAILHYTSPPIMGGVEAVIYAHSRELVLNGHDVTIIAGRGDTNHVVSGLPWGAHLKLVPEMDSLDDTVLSITNELNKGIIPDNLDSFTNGLEQILRPILHKFDNVFIHNLWTKHFNLPLTIALFRIFDSGDITNLINWCHDFTWGSPNSGHKVHAGFPWDLLRTYNKDVTYVVGSNQRQKMLVDLFAQFNDELETTLLEKIKIIPNGVNPSVLIGLTNTGQALVEAMNLFASDLILLMPVRISQAKNIEFALEIVREIKNLVKLPKLVITGPPDPHNLADKKRFEGLRKQAEELGIEDNVHFVNESGLDKTVPNLIDHQTVGQLMRVADLVFMPSHREGFGIPIFEAGLLRVPIWCSDNVPAAKELKNEGVNIFNLSTNPTSIANEIVASLQRDSQHNIRREIRQNYTWSAIYNNNIKPLVN